MENGGLLFHNDLIDFLKYLTKIYSTYYVTLNSTNLLDELE